MNLSTLAIALLAWQLLSQPQRDAPKKQQPDFTGLLSDDTKSIIDSFGKLSSKNCSGDDKLSAILQMMTNPMVMNLAQSLFPQQQSSTQETQEQPFTNDEGYKFDTPSQDSKEFFRPIENIADAEVKNKLYKFYDNWYVK